MKPLILPLKTPFGFYFYETQKNDILSINKELYEYLVKLLKDNEDDINLFKKCKKQIGELQELGYLSPSKISCIEHPQTKIIENLLERKLNMVTLQLTQMCNLRCDYCIYSEKSSYNRSHSNHRMSFETAKRVIDFYYEHSIDSERIAIAFYGGEPTLEFELIKRIVDYANKVFAGKKILYRMTTNATLLTDELIDFFFNSQNDFLVLISLDGSKSIQDKNRKFSSGKGSYDIIMDNLKRLVEKNPFYAKKIHINSVINPKNEYSEMISLLDEPLLKEIPFQFNLVENDGMPVEYEIDYLKKFNYDMFLGYMTFFRDKKKMFPNKLIEYNFSYIKDNIDKFNSIDLGNVSAPGGPCEPGRMRLFVDYKGDFFPCERVSESSECMHIGSIDSGFDIKKIKSMLNIGEITEEKCKNCWAFYLCNICIKRADYNGVVSVEKKLKACSLAKRAALDKILLRPLNIAILNNHIALCNLGFCA